MKNFKKISSIVMAGVFLFSSMLTGCSSSQTSESSQTSTVQSSSAADKPAAKDNYPTKPVQIIVPTGTGGDTDINARLFSKYMEKELGKPFVVSNVTGAGGVVGSRQVKDAAPDGYTALFFHYGTLTQTLMGTADFDILKDFDVVGIPIIDNTSVIVSKKGGKYNTMADLMNDAKANPNKVRFAIEVGTVAHLMGYVLQDLGSVQFKLVDTGVAATKNAALLSGQSDAFFAQYLGVKEYVKSGSFNLLGVISDERNPGLPDVPTLKEQGIDISLPKFFFFAFPKGTPEDIKKKFRDTMEKVVKNEEAKKEFANYFVDLKYYDENASKELITKTKDIFAKYTDKIKK